MSDAVLTIKEVAVLPGLADNTACSMVRQAELPAFKVRGRWRIWQIERGGRWALDPARRGQADGAPELPPHRRRDRFGRARATTSAEKADYDGDNEERDGLYNAPDSDTEVAEA